MSRKTLALAAITALALSAHTHAQVLYNWTLNYVAQSGSKPDASGSGTLTLTGNEVTAMTGTMFGGSVTLLP